MTRLEQFAREQNWFEVVDESFVQTVWFVEEEVSLETYSGVSPRYRDGQNLLGPLGNKVGLMFL